MLTLDVNGFWHCTADYHEKRYGLSTFRHNLNCRFSYQQGFITARKLSLRRLCFTPVCQSFCSQGGSTWAGTPPREQVHPLPDQIHPPGTWYTTPLGPGTPHGTRYTPVGLGTPPPWDQVHPMAPGTPPGAGTPSWDWVHPPGPGTPTQTRYIPPRTRYKPPD